MMKSATTSVETSTTLEAVTSPIASSVAAIPSAPVVPASVAAVVTMSIVATPVVATPIKAPAVISRSVVPVVPRSGTDEDAAYEVVRPVVSIGSASIRVVIVIPV